MERYIQILLEMEKNCKEFKKSTVDNFFEEAGSEVLQGYFCYTQLYQSQLKPIKGLAQVIEIFGIDVLERNKDALLIVINQLENPLLVEDRNHFEYLIDVLLEVFSEKTVQEAVRHKLSILKPEETDRLNEAIHCFLGDCNYSTVAMSVSAIEFRLLSLMTSIHSDSNLYEMTLGQLIGEYLSNKKKYGRIIPKKYEPLLEHCNTYRIFSVHPKKEKINKSIATSIFHMTFQFLLDKKLAQKASGD